MKTVAFILCALAAESLCVNDRTLQDPEWRWPDVPIAGTTFYPRTDFVNLDDPPKVRWVRVIEKYRSEIIPYFVHWQKVLDQHTQIDQPMWAQLILNSLSDDYRDEMEGIVGSMNHSAVSWQSLLLLQAMYEMGSPMACSEVLVASQDGVVLHGRNLDYIPISVLIEITFLRGGEPLFIAPMFLGKVGIHTGVKPGHWGYGQNTRTESNDTPASALVRLAAGSELGQTFVRSLMERDLPYSDVVRELQDVPLLRDVYMVVSGAGPYEGAVMARAADPAYRHIDRLSEGTPGGWYLVQTNDDLGAAPRDERRDAGINSLVSLGRTNISPLSILRVMMKPPVYTDWNVLLFMASPRSGEFCTVLGPASVNDDTE
eukprot:CAMPEP_0179320242 /NCGR_PEP_ID=MMETSP0797-20121207/57940_1 /TAXON_ID=47934 /ORGANISM="Dinophysis acuminata, Strain DAEP01" /LENGTH=371 /DNA_ID=CAMNT_0021031719 /DNA_START=66 /DNA_END=1178 /DNA_ORIENTATION=-